MNQQQLQDKREELEARLKRMEDTHYAKFVEITSESAYRDSSKEMNKVYNELFLIYEELGKPMPVRL